MCRNGQYRERGIKQLRGFCSERFRTPSQCSLRVGHEQGLSGVLLEPASIIAKESYISR